MTEQETLNELQTMGTAQNRKVYARHGVGGEMFGVSYANLNKLKKRIKADHPLALQLWESGNHDARVLACMVADPEQCGADLLERWVADLDNYVLCDAFSQLAAASPQGWEKAQEWMPSREEWRGRAGWTVAAILSGKDPSLDDDQLLSLVKTAEKEIHQRPNRTRDAMLNAVIAIGLRSEEGEAAALQAARSIGKVDVDHGQTSCKTPDIREYIARAKKRRPKR
ncbi:MAG TPA: DNA alkylation repair protein [Acidobacteriota bacterium]|nr:DNA alkylation repair protein [Acidobacteriota bacterium]